MMFMKVKRNKHARLYCTRMIDIEESFKIQPCITNYLKLGNWSYLNPRRG